MSIRCECPECEARLNLSDDVRGKKVRCPKCRHAFRVPDEDERPARARKEAVQATPLRRPASRRRAEEDDDFDDDVDRPSRRLAKEKAGSGMLIALLVGGTVLLLGGGAVAWVLLSRNDEVQAAEAPRDNKVNEPAAQKQPPQDQKQPPGDVAVVPEARPEAGNEEFVDLPERGKDANRIAGLDMPPQPKEGDVPFAPVKVQLSAGRAFKIKGKAGMAFEVHYRFVQGTPAGGVRYAWIITTAKGKSFRQSLSAAEVRAQGTLVGRALGSAWFDAPYQTFLAVERRIPGRPGVEFERISDVLMLR